MQVLLGEKDTIPHGSSAHAKTGNGDPGRRDTLCFFLIVLPREINVARGDGTYVKRAPIQCQK
jgi:hypothetical protein